MLDRNRNRSVSIERHTACYHLIHCDSERIDVTLVIGISATHLLRRAVMYTSHNIGADGVGRSRLCNTKIRKFYLSVCGNDDILWFDIAMYNITVMRRFKTERNLNCDAGRLFYAQFSFAVNIIFEGNSLNKLHNNIVNTTVLPDIIYVYNIGMGQPCRCLRLCTEFADKCFILPKFRL